MQGGHTVIRTRELLSKPLRLSAVRRRKPSEVGSEWQWFGGDIGLSIPPPAAKPVAISLRREPLEGARSAAFTICMESIYLGPTGSAVSHALEYSRPEGSHYARLTEKTAPGDQVQAAYAEITRKGPLLMEVHEGQRLPSEGGPVKFTERRIVQETSFGTISLETADLELPATISVLDQGELRVPTEDEKLGFALDIARALLSRDDVDQTTVRRIMKQVGQALENDFYANPVTALILKDPEKAWWYDSVYRPSSGKAARAIQVQDKAGERDAVLSNRLLASGNHRDPRNPTFYATLLPDSFRRK